MEDYRTRAKTLLKRKRFLETAADALREQVLFLETESAARQNDLAARELRPIEAEDWKRLLSKLDDCRFRLHLLEEQLEQIRRAYEVLTPYQRDLLETFFASGSRNCAETLCERYYRERSAIYRDRSKALDQFTIAAYGVLLR